MLPRQPTPPLCQPSQEALAATVSEGANAIKQRKWRTKETTAVNSKQSVVDPTLDKPPCSTPTFFLEQQLIQSNNSFMLGSGV